MHVFVADERVPIVEAFPEDSGKHVDGAGGIVHVVQKEEGQQTQHL